MKRIILILVCILFVSIVNSQTLSPQVITSSGSYFVGSKATLSWTLGECIIETGYSTTNILTQGFQQPEYAITGIEEETNNNFKVSVYPNPAIDYITIEITSNPPIDERTFKVKIIDLSGKVFYQQLIKQTIKDRLIWLYDIYDIEKHERISEVL